MPGQDWRVSIPMGELMALVNFQEDVNRMHAENEQFRRELDGLRNMFTDLAIQFGDVKREIKGR